MKNPRRRLEDLVSVGPALFCDLGRLGIGSMRELARSQPTALYERLGRIDGRLPDICVLDAFRAAVAQARNPRLPAEQCQWWWWSRKRQKAQISRAGAGRRR